MMKQILKSLPYTLLFKWKNLRIITVRPACGWALPLLRIFYGEGGGRGVQDGAHMYTHGRFFSRWHISFVDFLNV